MVKENPSCTHCTVDVKSSVAVVTILRTEVRNALHPPASWELSGVFDRLANDESVRVVILTGSGNQAFCAGNDLKYLAQGGSTLLPPSGFGGLTGRFDFPKPVIAAVNGVAFGGGFELALACDLIVADPQACFSLPEPKVGQVATAGGLLRLPRQIPLKQAMGIILAGKKVSAEEALALGVVNEVSEPGKVLECALTWAHKILLGSPLAISAAKELVNFGLARDDIAQCYAKQKQLPALMTLYASDQSKEGARAFKEKRVPDWVKELQRG